MCILPQHRGGGCFCTCGAMQGFNIIMSIVALAKAMTPEGVPGGGRGGLYR